MVYSGFEGNGRLVKWFILILRTMVSQLNGLSDFEKNCG
jgi:hypothetical protein